MKYICVRGFSVTKYDDDGFSTSDYVSVKPGDAYELIDISRRFVGGPNSVRLESLANGCWLEITHDRFRNCFVPAEEIINESN